MASGAPRDAARGSGAPGRGRWAPLRAFRTPLRGHAFAAPPVDGARLEPDVPVRLRREPDNPADPLAVAVWTEADAGGARPWRLGYLDRGVAARIAPRLDDGVELAGHLEGWVSEPRGRWMRPLLRVEPSVTIADPVPGERAGGPAGAVTGEGQHGTGTEPPTGIAARPPGVRRRVLGRRRPGGTVG